MTASVPSFSCPFLFLFFPFPGSFFTFLPLPYSTLIWTLTFLLLCTTSMLFVLPPDRRRRRVMSYECRGSITYGHSTSCSPRRRYMSKSTRFCAACNVTITPASIFIPPPNLHMVMGFFKWQARHKKGLLDTKITVKTMLKYWTEFRLEIRRHTGHEYKPREIRDVENVCIVIQHREDHMLKI